MGQCKEPGGLICLGGTDSSGLDSDCSSSGLGCLVRGCLSPWHHLVTHGLITRHQGPVQAPSSCLPRWMTLLVVRRGCPWGSRFLLEHPFLLDLKEALSGAEIPRLPACENRLETWTEKSISPPLSQTFPSALTVWDQRDVLRAGAQEVVHGAAQEQGLVHPVQLQGAVHAVDLQLRMVRGVGLQPDLCRLVPQQPGGLPLGAAPGPGEDKGI